MSEMRFHTSPLRVLFALLAVAFIALPAVLRAQTVSAELSQEFAAINQPVLLNIIIINGRATQLPSQVPVDGLDIRFAGNSNRVDITNGKRTDSSVYSYQVTPLRTGDFIIPPITVGMGGRTAKTLPLKLRVGGNSGGMPVLPAIPMGPGRQPSGPYGQYSQQPPQPQQQVPQSVPLPKQPDPDRIAFGELVIPKKSAYVGEVVPVEFRFYVASTVPMTEPEMAPFAGDGFTVMKYSTPTMRQQEIDGMIYNVIAYQTALTAVKSGELEIPPAAMRTQIRVSMSAPQGMDDFISNFFANSGFGMELRDVEVTTKPTKLEVKPLPREGRPDDFAGAIGQFTLRSTASPKKAQSGDPISLDVTVSGRGNFEALGAPTLMDAEAWKSYPPNESFRASPSDPIGYNGEKTFKYMIVARTDATLTPEPVFSFFDPSVEKYVTLRSAPIAVSAKGSSGSVPATAMAASPTATPTPTAAPSVPAVVPTPSGAGDVLVKVEPANFEPFILSQGFLMANAFALLVWLALALIGIVTAILHSGYARRSQQRRDARKLLQRTEDPALSPEEFFAAATSFVRARLAPEGSLADTRDLLLAADIKPETRDGLQAILNYGDAWRYSPGAAAQLGADQRQQLISHLKSLDEELR